MESHTTASPSCETVQQAWNICFTDLTVGYGKHVVLQNITAELPAGAVSLLLGESGSGKSTLLRHIIGLARPISGTVRIAGQDFFSLAPKDFRRLRRNMGVLFQDGALLGSLKVWENVALPLTEHLALPKDLVRAEAERVLAMVELSHAAESYPNQLSGGMRKRAGLARAIITNPSLLLCDEPTSGLDPLTAARMDELVLSLHAQFPAMTIVVVSHDLASLRRIAEHVLVIKDGHCVFSGSAHDLLSSKDPYLTRFLLRESDVERTDFSTAMDPRVADALGRWLTR